MKIRNSKFEVRIGRAPLSVPVRKHRAILLILSFVILSFVILLSTFALRAANPDVVYNTARFTGVRLTNAPITLTPIPLSSQSNTFILPIPVTNVTDAAGSCTFSNVFPTSYKVEIKNGNERTIVFTNCIPDQSGTIYADGYICAARATNGLAFNMQQSDLRYPSVAGTNILFTTNASGRVVINATGSSTGASALLVDDDGSELDFDQ
jgi:hypothetical protein